MKCRAMNVPCEPPHWFCRLALTLIVQSQSSGDELPQWPGGGSPLWRGKWRRRLSLGRQVGAVTDDTFSRMGRQAGESRTKTFKNIWPATPGIGKRGNLPTQ